MRRPSPENEIAGRSSLRLCICLLLLGCGSEARWLEDGLTECVPQGEGHDDLLVLIDGNGGQTLATSPLVTPSSLSTPELVGLAISQTAGQATFVGSQESELWPFLVEGPSTQGEGEIHVTDRAGKLLLRASIAFDGEGSIFTPTTWSSNAVFQPRIRSHYLTPTCSRTADPTDIAVVPLGTSSKTRERLYAAMTNLSSAVGKGPRRTSAVIFGIRTGVPALYSTFWLFSSRKE
jgi:hypothetical protein